MPMCARSSSEQAWGQWPHASISTTSFSREQPLKFMAASSQSWIDPATVVGEPKPGPAAAVQSCGELEREAAECWPMPSP